MITHEAVLVTWQLGWAVLFGAVLVIFFSYEGVSLLLGRPTLSAAVWLGDRKWGPGLAFIVGIAIGFLAYHLFMPGVGCTVTP